MAKKHQQRAHVSVRKKQEQEQKQQQRKEYLKKNKKKICILAVLAVIIIAGAILMIDYFGGPKGAMKVFMGKVQDVAENSVVANLGTPEKPAYYTVAWFTPVEGYTADHEFFVLQDTNEQRLMYRADSEDAMINTISLSGIRQKKAAEYVEQLYGMGTSMGIYSTCSEAKERDIAGHHVHYLYATTDNTYADPETGIIPDETTATLITYSDTVAGGCIYVGLTSRAYPKNQVPTEEMLLLEAEEFFTHVEMLQPDFTRK